MSKKKYSFLLTAMNAHGPVNATLGFGELLQRHGHHVTFAHMKKFKKAAESRNFQFLSFTEGEIKDDDGLLNVFEDNYDTFRIDPLERFKNYSDLDKERLSLLTKEYRKLDLIFRRIVAAHHFSFDAIVQDWCDLTGSLFATDHPVISLQSANPLLLYLNGPPFSFGLSTKSDPNFWKEITDIFMEANSVNIERTNAMLAEFNRPPIFDPLHPNLPVKSIGFYHYPAPLDYEEYEPKESGWHRVDCFIRSAEPEPIGLPLEFLNKPGKLIYFSLGSSASNDLKLMRQILSILAKAPHKFIISKGFRGHLLELADNMWGENYLDQIQVLQLVDLVITHGGNNSFMETLHYGKPLIVIPYCFDQYDNAQRVVDKNIGYRINMWELTDELLLDCIEKTLKDEDMQNRIKAISQSMRDSDSGPKAVAMIENIIVEAKAARSRPTRRLN